ncbi:MAG TPA: uridine diphosphate-N-acetylglucosamine-binding protein YvcK [Candidatus Saccharimonadales bacterium]|nr:uridine diphosphate-N-acetylglucosamine-binding protein YvcK [Candidatus Saccharimonadales bacterium]
MAESDPMTSNNPNIAVIGGGTGSFSVLSSLKNHSEITAIVNMVDDGGSTGELRDSLGVLPPGDLRQCMVALSEESDIWRDVLNFRFPKNEKDTSLGGHNLGNLLISGIETLTGGEIKEAIATVSKMLNIKGKVIPVTVEDRRLVITTVDGQTITGEHNIEDAEIPSLKGATVGFDLPTELDSDAAEAIRDADMLVIAPGDLYTSIGPALAVNGMRGAIMESKAKKIYLCNLVNKEFHTSELDVEGYTDEIERIIGAPALDYVVYNTQSPSPEVLERYFVEKQYPVAFDVESLEQRHYRAIGASLLSTVAVERDPNDRLKRSLIRHDHKAIAKAVMAIYWQFIM